MESLPSVVILQSLAHLLFKLLTSAEYLLKLVLVVEGILTFVYVYDISLVLFSH